VLSHDAHEPNVTIPNPATRNAHPIQREMRQSSNPPSSLSLPYRHSNACSRSADKFYTPTPNEEISRSKGGKREKGAGGKKSNLVGLPCSALRGSVARQRHLPSCCLVPRARY